MNEYEEMKSITEMYRLRDCEIDNKTYFAKFEGFVVPPNYIYHYQETSLHVKGYVCVTENEGKVAFFACIKSLDDAGISFHGPQEELGKAMKRYKSFKELIEERHPFAPENIYVLEFWCKMNGVSLDKW